MCIFHYEHSDSCFMGSLTLRNVRIGMFLRTENLIICPYLDHYEEYPYQ